jgi:protein-L-isoaspartate(D-aspartate) O-methyltransferase
MSDLDAYRRFFAEEIEAVGRLRTAALVDAFASVPRERFLRPGPWTVNADVDYVAGASANAPAATRTTPDADPRRVYHNIAVAIDPDRRLFNGQPATLAVWIEALALAPGMRVLHVGCGLGYYTAVMAHVVGTRGHVTAFEVDGALAAEATRNVAGTPWVAVHHGDASNPGGRFDAVLVNAGVTHPLDTWLDALDEGGRLILPLTAAMPGAGNTIGKGLVFVATKDTEQSFTVRMVGVVAVYSAVGIRDTEMNGRLGKALMAGPAAWNAVTRLRRDRHEPSSSCWLHGSSWCLSTV